MEDPLKYGITPADILRQLNVKKAKKYVENKGYPIRELEDALVAWRRKPENKMMWTSKQVVVDILFPDGTPTTEQLEAIKPKTIRRDEKNPNSIDVFKKLKGLGWNEAMFSQSAHKENFKNLLDFCNFASDNVLNEI